MVLITAIVFHHLIHFDTERQSLAKFLKENIKGVIFGILLLTGFSFYTSYRSDVAGLKLPDLLHSIADGAGYLIAIDRFPRLHDYWYGMTFLHPFVIYIPSVLFPTKYNYTFGVTEFTETIFGYEVLRDNFTTSHTYSFIGEFYVNFGWIGVFVGPLLVGYLNRKIYLRVKQRLLGNLGLVAYSIYYSGVIPYTVKSGTISGFEYFFQNVLLIFVFPIIAFSRKSRRTFRQKKS